MTITEVLIEWAWGEQQRVSAKNLISCDVPGHAHYVSRNSGMEHLVKVIGKLSSTSNGELLDLNEVPTLG